MSEAVTVPDMLASSETLCMEAWVKATARALNDAGLGDVISLQAADSTKRYQARVTGPQTVEVTDGATAANP